MKKYQWKSIQSGEECCKLYFGKLTEHLNTSDGDLKKSTKFIPGGVLFEYAVTGNSPKYSGTSIEPYWKLERMGFIEEQRDPASEFLPCPHCGETAHLKFEVCYQSGREPTGEVYCASCMPHQCAIPMKVWNKRSPMDNLVCIDKDGMVHQVAGVKHVDMRKLESERNRELLMTVREIAKLNEALYISVAIKKAAACLKKIGETL